MTALRLALLPFVIIWTGATGCKDPRETAWWWEERK